MPVILGVDFLAKHAVIVVFDQSLVYVRIGKEVIHTAGRQDKANMCYPVSTRNDPDPENDAVDECAVPTFSTVPGFTDVAHHTIPTANNPPVRVPPRTGLQRPISSQNWICNQATGSSHCKKKTV